MHCILYISRQGFYSTVQGRHSPETMSVIVDRGRVLDASPAAVTAGAKIGGLVSEAKAVLRSQARYIDYRFDDYVQARDSWLDVCLTYSDGVESPMPHEAFLDLSGHPRPVETASALLTQLGAPLAAGLAPCKWVARLASRPVLSCPSVSGLRLVEPVHDIPGFLASVPTSLLAPVPMEHRARLEFLGYRWAREVAQASLGVLLGQFGRDAFLIYESAHGRVLDKVENNYPAASVSHRVVFDSPVDDRFVVDDAMDKLTTSLALELSSKDASAAEVILVFEGEEGPPMVFRRKFGRPVQSALPLRVAVRALSDKVPLEFPPIAVRVTLLGIKSAPRSQRSLVGMASGSDRVRSCESALGCLQSAFGQSVVIKAGELRAPRRELVLRAWKRATGWS